MASRMSRRTRQLIFVLLVQAGCLGVGLWMQIHFVQSAAREEAIGHSWTRLEQVAGRILSKLDALAGHSDDGPSAILKGYSAALLHFDTEFVRAAVVDKQWRVLAEPDSVHGEFVPTLLSQTLQWNPILAADAADPALRRGTFPAHDATQMAVARDLRAGDAWLVVYRSRDALVASTDLTLSSLGGISVLTWMWTSILLGIATYMVIARLHDETERERGRAVSEHLHQRQTLLRTRDAVIFGLAKLADSRDPETGDHLERISVYSTSLASALRQHPKYAKEINSSFLRLIGISSALHDIGKVGVEDSILLKPGPLTPGERDRIKAHAEIGGRCLREIEQRLGSSNFLQMAREIAFSHHERWDGTGYPAGLAGEDIPLAARIVAIADVYDALSSRRVYKGPSNHDDCVRIIAEAAGKHFDPDMVRVWLKIHEKFRDIARRYTDLTVARRSDPGSMVSSAQEAEFQADRDGLVLVGAGAGL